MFRSGNRSETLLAVLLILAGASLRVLPHAWNVAPVSAIALFAGVVLPRRLALAVALGAMALSDAVLGLHSLFLLTWGSFALITLAAPRLLSGRAGFRAVVGASLAGSVFFFVVTNLGVFFVDGLYPMTVEGLGRCFWMALPFFRNTLAGDLAYASAVYLIFVWAQARFRKPVAAEVRATAS